MGLYLLSGPLGAVPRALARRAGPLQPFGLRAQPLGALEEPGVGLGELPDLGGRPRQQRGIRTLPPPASEDATGGKATEGASYGLAKGAYSNYR